MTTDDPSWDELRAAAKAEAGPSTADIEATYKEAERMTAAECVAFLRNRAAEHGTGGIIASVSSAAILDAARDLAARFDIPWEEA